MSDIEARLLSQMTSLDEIQKVADKGLRVEVFEDPNHAVMFEFMMNYWLTSKRQHAPTWIAMEAEFPSVPLPAEVEETTDFMIDWLKKRYTRNQVQQIARKSAEMMSEDAEAALSFMWQQAYAAKRVTAPATTYTDMSQTKQERRERYNRDRLNPDLHGVSFGLADLDAHTQGILAGELAAVAAYTKVGKSWLLANAFVSNHKTGKRPALFTLEMDIEDMTERIDCIYSGVSYSKMKKRELSFEEMDRLIQAQDELEAAGLAPLIRPERGDRTVKMMTTQARQMGADLILVDQLSWVDAEQRYTGDSATRMKHGDLVVDLADDIGSASAGKLATLMAVQLNRDTMRDPSGGGRGALKNFANSSMIEQTVHIALGLWQNQDMRNSNLMGLDIMGSRRGDRKSWLLNWHLNQRTEFRIEQEYEEDPQ